MDRQATSEKIKRGLFLSPSENLARKIARRIKRDHQSETEADYREAAVRILILGAAVLGPETSLLRLE